MQDGFSQPVESFIFFFRYIMFSFLQEIPKFFSYPNSALPHSRTTGKVNFQSSRAILLPIEFLSNFRC